jgi:hypothetical protein
MHKARVFTGFGVAVVLLLALTPSSAVSANLPALANVGFKGATDVKVQGLLAYVGSSDPGPDRGLWIIDVADPRTPSVVGRLECAGTPDTLAVHGNIVAMAVNGPDGTEVAPQAPTPASVSWT